MRRIICAALVSLIMGCATDRDFQPSSEEQCRIDRFVYKKDNGNDVSYKFTYTEGSFTQVSVITNEVLFGSTWTTDLVYKHNYSNDSLYIKDFRQFKEGTTYLTGLIQDIGSKAQTVVTNFPDNGATFRFSFNYTLDEQQITVTLERMTGNVAVFDSRGIYKLTDGVVDTLFITRNPDFHAGDADPYTSRTKIFTYDIIKNPLKDLVLVHLMKGELPDVTFFSTRNRLTEKYDDKSGTYSIAYGTDPMPVTITTPAGVVQRFEYINCTN